jgi:hypothetical protein
MAENLGEATLVLSTDASKLKEGLFQAQTLAEQTAQRFDKMASTVQSAFAFAGISIGLKQVFDATIAQERADRLLENAVRATGQAAGFTADQLKAQAAALQDTTTFSDDAIQSVQTQLLKFRNVQGEVFRDATKSILDFAANTGGDATEAVKMLGFALNNPVEGLTRLKRAGIDVNDALEQQVKNLVDMGQVTEAQRVILDEFQKTVGGSAEAMRNTLGGSLEALRNKFEDTFLEVKGPIVGQFTAAVNIITANLGLMNQIFNAVFAAIKSVVEDAMQIVFGFLDGIGKMIAGDWRAAMESFKMSGESFNVVGRAAVAAQEAFIKTGEQIENLEKKNKDLAESSSTASEKIITGNEERTRRLQDAASLEVEAINKRMQAAALQQQMEDQFAFDEVNRTRLKNEALILAEEEKLAKDEAALLRADLTQKDFLAKREALIQAHTAKVTAIQAKGAREVQLVERQVNMERLSAASGMAQNLITLAQNTGSRQTAFIKTLAITQATIDAFLAYGRALGSAPPPFNYALAATALAAGLSNVARITALEHGGKFSAGETILVGEAGPELLVPDRPGTIVPNNRLGDESGKEINVTQNFSVSGTDFSDESAARKMMSQMAAQMRQGVIEAVQLANATGDASILNSARAV